MGNTQPFNAVYSVEVEPSDNPNQTGTYRSATHPDQLVESFAGLDVENCWQLFQSGRKMTRSGRCLGYRVKNVDGSFGRFSWLTYDEIDKMVKRLGSAFIDLGFVNELEFPEEKYDKARKLKEFGILSKNRVEWFLCEQAANAYGITIVPLYDTLGDDSIGFILNQTKIETVACSGDSVPLLIKAALSNTTYLAHIISFDAIDAAIIQEANSHKIQVHFFENLLRHDITQEPCPGDRSSVASLCYTSGTTGNPKGVTLTQGNFVACVTASIRGPLTGNMNGGSIGIYSGDTSKLLEDVRELKPTVFISVPRLYNRINARVFGGIKEKSAVAQYLFSSGVSSKLSNLRNTASVTHLLWDRLVFNRIKQLMGGRLRYMVTGGAPLDALIQERMKVLFCSPLCEGYGLTETVGGSFITNPGDPLSGHVGGPVPCLEFRLESVPDMEYEITSDPPRGELLLRGPALYKGYFMNPEETESSIDKDGWFHTGDVVVLLPNCALKIIDRKKNIFKLAQGEYIVPEKIENIYQQSLFVAQVFAFGYSSKFVLIGIVVPDAEASAKWAAKNGKQDKELKELCVDPEFKKAVMWDMEIVAKEGGLRGFEKLKEVTLYPEQFTTENGLLTPTFKLKRYYAKQFFEKEIDAMYTKLEQ